MKHRNTAFTLVFLIFGIQSATAGNFSFTGNFNQDDEVKFFTFSIAAPGAVTLQTLSFSGGGFAPYLYLWNSAGTYLSGVEPSPVGDAVYTTNLTNFGSYIVALTENDNKAFGDLPGGVMDPAQFDHFGQGNFTVPEFSYTPDIPGAFFAPDGSQHTSAWALDVKFVDSAQAMATVPLPGTFSLVAAGLALLWPFARRRQASGH